MSDEENSSPQTWAVVATLREDVETTKRFVAFPPAAWAETSHTPACEPLREYGGAEPIDIQFEHARGRGAEQAAFLAGVGYGTPTTFADKTLAKLRL